MNKALSLCSCTFVRLDMDDLTEVRLSTVGYHTLEVYTVLWGPLFRECAKLRALRALAPHVP